MAIQIIAYKYALLSGTDTKKMNMFTDQHTVPTKALNSIEVVLDQCKL